MKLHLSPGLALPLELVTESVEVLVARGCANVDDLVRRFWLYVMPEPNTGCWLWIGGDVKGYGVLSLGGGSRRKILAHRFSFLVFKGPLGDNEMVLHRCDTPPCCNPAHLFKGGPLENMRDASAKGRIPGGGAKGERCHLARLTETTVREIRARAAGGAPVQVLAREHGLTDQGIWAIVRRRTWRHVA